MNEEEHKKKHEDLHRAFDELMDDWMTHTQRRPSKSSVLELLEWSFRQTAGPDHTAAMEAK